MNENIPDDLTDNLDLLMAIINRAMVQIVPSAEPAEQVPVVEDELRNPPEEVVNEDENEQDADAEDDPNEENEPFNAEELKSFQRNFERQAPFHST